MLQVIRHSNQREILVLEVAEYHRGARRGLTFIPEGDDKIGRERFVAKAKAQFLGHNRLKLPVSKGVRRQFGLGRRWCERVAKVAGE